MASKRRSNLLLYERYSIVQAVSNGEKQVDVAKRFKIGKQGVSNLIKDKDKIIKAYECNVDLNKKSQRCIKSSSRFGFS